MFLDLLIYIYNSYSYIN